MADEWIYDAPPPPPTSTNNALASARHSHKRPDRGSNRNAQPQPRLQPAMHLTHQTPEGHIYGVPNVVPPHLELSSRTYTQPNMAPVVDEPVQYNSAGYALSSTYNPATQTAARSTKSNSVVNFHGKSISLETEEDIAAWIAERKRKWPTEANVQKKLVEAKGKPDAHPKKKIKVLKEPRRLAGTHPPPSTQFTSHTIENANSAAESTAADSLEETSRQVPSSSLDVALAALSRDVETDANEVTHAANDADANTTARQDNEASQAPLKDPGTADVSSDDDSESTSISSSNSSDKSSDDDDDVPVATSSKVALPELEVIPAQPSQSILARPKRLCKYFKQGRCSRGEACTYSHDSAASDTRPRNQAKSAPRIDDRYKWRKRKSLYDRLVENEIQQEKRMAETTAAQDAKVEATID